MIEGRKNGIRNMLLLPQTADVSGFCRFCIGTQPISAFVNFMRSQNRWLWSATEIIRFQARASVETV